MSINKVKKSIIAPIVALLVGHWVATPPASAVEALHEVQVPIGKVFKPKNLAKISPSRSKQYAKSQMKRWKWNNQSQFTCLARLWTHESHWNHRAKNKWSGAYGIPQALPASKMKSQGKDYLTNPVTQIDWGMKYIKLRYGNPCGAWSHFQSHNWY